MSPLTHLATPRARHARVAIVLGASLSLTLAACTSAGEPPVSASSASSTPAVATPSPSPSAAPHQIVTGADVAILDRLESPTTGETWHSPQEIDSLDLFAYPSYGMEDTYRYFKVGTLGNDDLVVATTEFFDYYMGGYAITAMFALTDTGAALITCPSARTGDSCVDWSTDWERTGRYLEPGVAFDSLTYPSRVEPLPGWSLEPARLATSNDPTSTQAFGDANGFPSLATTPDERDYLGRDDTITLAELGHSRLVEYRSAGDVTGLIDSRFAILTPFDSVIPSESAFAAAYYGQGAVTWNDGVDTFMHETPPSQNVAQQYPVRAASLACGGPDETLAADFDPSQWQVAGTHQLGFDVYLPVPGGNPLAQQVWQTMRDSSWGEDMDPGLAYPFGSVDQFLANRSVFAWERPDGEWVIAIDSFAGQRVFECV